MRAKITILGGSSPFTAGLFGSLEAASSAVPASDLVLQGRSPELLPVLARHAEALLGPLGWTVHSTTSRAEALEGAAIVLHQARYGGLSERAEGERLSSAYAVPADETLGPAALRCALRAAPALMALAEEIRRACPEAWILNLTNPLSLTTAILARAGLRSVGLCELPRATAHRAAARLGLDPDEVEWSYTGLNHRGFIHALAWGGRDHIGDLAASLGPDGLDGVTAADIEATGAIPLKYFRLLSGGVAGASGRPGRAEYLAGLRDRILDELRRSPGAPPPSLERRSMEWYPLSVVPFLAAITAGDGRVEVVNVMAADGIVREIKARISRDRIEPVSTPPPPKGGAVSRWMDVFAAHERAALAAVLDPDPDRITAAIAADPLVPEAIATRLAAEIWRGAGSSTPR